MHRLNVDIENETFDKFKLICKDKFNYTIKRVIDLHIKIVNSCEGDLKRIAEEYELLAENKHLL